MPDIPLTPVGVAKPNIRFFCIPPLPDFWHHDDCTVTADRTPDDYTHCTGLEHSLQFIAGTGQRGHHHFLVHAQIPFGMVTTCGVSL